MPRTLPAHPSFRFLQKEAKDLLKAQKSGDTSCCPTLRYHFRFSRAADEEILKADVSLQEVQHALALDYGFRSWKETKGHVEAGATPEIKDESEASAAEILQQILSDAVAARASDVHIEPMSSDVKVRCRIDGVLSEVKSLPKDQGKAVVDEAMRLGALNLEARDVPQDGRYLAMMAGRSIDFRIASAPVVTGTTVVFRILDKTAISIDLDRLGLDAAQLEVYRELLHLPYGLILVTGPTGSGKTTTLYGSLREINDVGRKIMTVEDPVEYQIEGMDQMPLGNLTWRQAITSMLRQAPNVLMIGELRDLDVADICMEASLSGHLVFGTLHANDAPGAIYRLLDMGVKPFLVSSAVRGVLAQRLARRICDGCREARAPSEEELDRLGIQEDDRGRPIFLGRGCKQCRQTGYRGRTGVYSLLRMTPDVQAAIIGGDSDRLREETPKALTTTLRAAALAKLFAGETSVEEVIKFT